MVLIASSIVIGYGLNNKRPLNELPNYDNELGQFSPHPSKRITIFSKGAKDNEIKLKKIKSGSKIQEYM